MSDAWYYVDNGALAGPIHFTQLRRFLCSPRGGRGALVWHQGLPRWHEVATQFSAVGTSHAEQFKDRLPGIQVSVRFYG